MRGAWVVGSAADWTVVTGDLSSRSGSASTRPADRPFLRRVLARVGPTLAGRGDLREGAGPFAYVDVLHLWHRVRLAGCVVAVTIGVGFLFAGYAEGMAPVAIGLVVMFDAWYRSRRDGSALWLAFVIDGALIAVAAPLIGMHRAALVAAFAYLGTAALLFLATRQAMGVISVIGALVVAAQWLADTFGLRHPDPSPAVGIAGALAWTAFLFTLVWVVSRTVAVFQSERDADQARLEQMMVDKSQFVATVSHEVRGPLTAVLGLAEQLRDAPEVFSPEERAEFVRLIAGQATEAAAIVEDLLLASGLETGTVTFKAEPIDLEIEVDSVVRTISDSATVRRHASDEPSAAIADPARVRQIVRNLITNARRYGGPTIVVATAPGIVSVDDDGQGVPPSDVERIFEAFGRSDVHDHGAGSSGLGLAVSRSLARMMGGDLTYERSEGWTRFVLRLPVDATVPLVGATTAD